MRPAVWISALWLAVPLLAAGQTPVRTPTVPPKMAPATPTPLKVVVRSDAPFS
jgi:hypothetical protein